MSYIGIASSTESRNRDIEQQGDGIGEDALNYVSKKSSEIAKGIKSAGQFVFDNKATVFKNVSNAQRFVAKNISGDTKPIRYLKNGETHAPLHNFTGPGTRIDLPEVRNFKPYNGIDACSKIHDFQFDKIFKMPLGKARSEAIRKADIEAIKCYNKHPNDKGYLLAKTGINSKMTLEDISPAIFDKIMGEDYRGVQPGLKQKGGSMSLAEMYRLSKIVSIPAVALAGYGEYRLGKMIYDRLKRNNKVEKETNDQTGGMIRV